MKLIESIKQIISEASKKQILMDKIGFDEDNADVLDRLCGSLSVWMGNKFIDVYGDYVGRDASPENRKSLAIKYINDNALMYRERGIITSVMDWIRVDLNGNLGENKELSLNQLRRKAYEWHDSLEVGQGSINYKEPHTHDIILDFRDNDGNGFYWVSLNTKNSPEECERMGHCGRSSYGYLYSLRQVVPVNNKYKLNKSVLTAAIGEDGIMYQLKGVKNSKPKDEYHQYIQPLFYVLGKGGEEDDYLIQGFGTEYASEQDFKLSDLPEQTIKDLYQNRPELFSSRTLQRLLGKMGIVEYKPLPTTFVLEIKPINFDSYIDGATYSNSYYGNTGQKKRVSIFERVMDGDAWDLWGNRDNEDLSSYFQYTIDKPTEEKLWSMVKDFAQKNGIELDDSLSLEDAINEVDDNWEIRGAIGGAINDADANDYVDYLQNEIKSALEYYGNVYEFNYDGAKIQIDLSNLVDIEDNQIDEIYENSVGYDREYNLESVLDELIQVGIIEKPDYDPDNRWYPSPDSSVVNQQVNDRLNEI
jgi:hypothetical protein